MKKLILLIIAMYSQIVFTQNCYVGNNSSVGFNQPNLFFDSGYIFAAKYTLINSGELISLNLIAREAGAQAKLALYSDNNGRPGNLIASTLGTLQMGIVSMPTEPINLSAGNYWIASVFDTGGYYPFCRIDNTMTNYYYRLLDFSQAMPANGNSFIGQIGLDFTYFLEVSCSQLSSMENTETNKINFYPNPVIDEINISLNDNFIGCEYTILDSLGRKILSGILDSKTNRINTNHLQQGIFIMQVSKQTSKQTFKFIKA